MVKDGYGAPFLRIHFEKIELSQFCTRLRYTMDEENDDEVELSFELENPNELDKPQWQEGAKYELVWGYIQGEISNKRTVYIKDVKPSATRENIKLVVSCAEKGISLKSGSSKIIHKNKTLPEIANDYAKKHGLKGALEVDPSNQDIKVTVEPIPGERLDQYLIREANAKAQKRYEQQAQGKTSNEVIKIWLDDLNKSKVDPVLQKERELKEKYQRDWEDGATIDVEQSTEGALRLSILNNDLERAQAERRKQFDSLVKNNPDFLNSLDKFVIHKNVPQANKSDKQILDELAKREPNGPYVVKTRDDEVIIKRRNFGKLPFFTYEYGGPSGELLDFSPQSSKRNRSGSSLAMGFGGWNPLDKTTFSGTNTPADQDPSLAKAIEMLKFYKNIQKTPGAGKLLVGERFSQPVLGVKSNQPVENKIDNTGIWSNNRHAILITLDDKIRALEKAIQEFTVGVDTKKKEMYNALGVNPTTAYEQAANLRRDSELNSNPATATVWGKPQLEDGMILTFLGVGKKYSGNYYVKKVTHELDKSGGYLVDMEMYRQGHNIKTNKDYASSVDLGRPVNNAVGASDKTSNDKTLPITQNPKNK